MSTSKTSKDLAAEKARKQYIAVKRAERRLINRLNDIEWEYDVLKPELERVNEELTKGILPEFQLVEDTTQNDQNND